MSLEIVVAILLVWALGDQVADGWFANRAARRAHNNTPKGE